MAHTKDVIFTENAVKDLIKKIRQNPEMTSKIVVDTGSDHGIKVTQADGNYTRLKTGDKVELYELSYGTSFVDGAIPLKINSTLYYINLTGKAGTMDSTTTATKIPQVGAVRGYVSSYVTEQLNGLLNDKLYNTTKKRGYIPGSYSDAANGMRTWTVKKENADNAAVAELSASKVYGAVFNDYAEYRSTVAAAPGQVVIERGDGTMRPSTKRLELGGNIVSDTFGFAIGETEYARTPIAVCGRVLAYTDADTDTFTPGAAVCSGPNGTVSMMTREEIREWPDAIIGYVSEIPTYEVWGTEQVHVNGRIWIKVK